jgi:hypothetical protein
MSAHVKDGDIVDSGLISIVGRLCDISDGSAWAWFHVYSASTCRPELEHIHRLKPPRTGLYWAVVLGLVVGASYYLDVSDAASSETEDIDTVFVEAAKNKNCGAELTALLLQRRGDSISMTQEVIVAAAQNGSNGKDIITLLLKRRAADVQITQEVVVAAAQNRRNGKDIIALLLNRRAGDVQITQELVIAIVRNFDIGVTTLLLNCYAADV